MESCGTSFLQLSCRAGRGKCQEVVKVLQSPSVHDFSAWKNIEFYIFDRPSAFYKNYETRMEVKKYGNAFVKIAQRMPCLGKQHLSHYFTEITSNGGEGVILRKPKSFYKIGKSATFLKLEVQYF